MQSLSYKPIFIFIILSLCLYGGIRLADQSQIITTFPLESLNDVSSYMVMLHFTHEIGYHGMVYKWYAPEGFKLFETDAPGWYYFTLPIYLLVKDVKPATFISLIAIYIIFAILFLAIGKIEKLSKLETLAFFALFAFSPMAIGDYVRQMRMPQMFSWISLLVLFAIIFYYKDKKIDWKFMIIAPFIALLILSHQLETVLFFFAVIPCIFLIKSSFRERAIIALSGILGIFMSAFWLVPFILNSVNSPKLEYAGSRWLLEFSTGFQFANIAGIMLGIALLAVFVLYLNKNQNWKQEALFFSPVIVIDLLFLSRLVVYLPIIKHVYIDAYMQFFAFFFLLILFKCYKKFNFMKYVLALLPIGFILVSLLHTPWFVTPTQQDLDSLKIFEHVNGSYGFAGDLPLELYPMALVCYTAIYTPLNSSTGWSLSESIEHRHKTAEYIQVFFDNNEQDFLRLMRELKIDDVIAYGKDCEQLKSYNMHFKAKEGLLCLYSAS